MEERSRPRLLDPNLRDRPEGADVDDHELSYEDAAQVAMGRRISALAAVAFGGSAVLGVVAAELTAHYVPEANVSMPAVFAWTALGLLITAAVAFMAFPNIHRTLGA